MKILASILFLLLSLLSMGQGNRGFFMASKTTVAAVASDGFSRAVTVDRTKVGENVTDFPVLFSGTYSYLATVANGGKVNTVNDIRFYADADLGVLLDFEIERWDATTGEIQAWFKTSLTTTDDKVVYLAYGKSTHTSDVSNVTGVWSNGYAGVWHLKDGTTLSTVDALGVNNGTNNGATATAGKIDGGANFNGSSHISATTPTISKTTPITFSSWINMSGASLMTIMADWNITVSAGWEFTISEFNSGKIGLLFTNSGGTNYFGRRGSTNVNTGQNVYVVATFDGSASNTGINLYVNGSAETHTNLFLGTSDPGTLVNGNFRIGSRLLSNSGNQFMNGLIDDARISSIARSANWILTEYNNQNSPSTFYSIGGEL